MSVMCYHVSKRSMTWPDGSTSEVCEKCLLTRNIDEISTTEWQDHNYKTIYDWYREAADLALSIFLNNTIWRKKSITHD